MVAYPGKALTLRASTGRNGYTLVNGTGPVISWTAPNDGNLHSVVITAVLVVSSAETGGTIAQVATNPDGTQRTFTLIAAGQGTGASPGGALNQLWPIAPGGTVTIEQYSALTIGAAVLYAEIWAD